MNILWPIKIDGTGMAYGYSRAGANLAATLEVRGHSILTNPADIILADISIHFCPPDHFRPIPGIPSILFSMFEAELLPESWISPIRT